MENFLTDFLNEDNTFKLDFFSDDESFSVYAEMTEMGKHHVTLKCAETKEDFEKDTDTVILRITRNRKKEKTPIALGESSNNNDNSNNSDNSSEEDIKE